MWLQWDQTREAPLRGGEPRLHSALERIGLLDDALTVSLEKMKKGGSAGMNHKVKKIWNAVSWLLVAAVVVLAVLLAGVRLVGITPYAVLSGSMEPTYPVGSLIYVKDADPEDVQVGDPITFVLNEDLVVATHRVIDIDEENGYFYKTYEAILKDARRLGYVEADESLDIDGWDAAHKIAILAYLAHGCWIGTDKMLVSGIRGIRLEDMIWARDFNCRVKLIAAIRKLENGALFASVYPALLPLTDVVANVNEVYNAVSLSGDVVGRTVHIGRGAGQDATASAVIADIADAIKSLAVSAPCSLSVARDSNLHLASLEEVSGEFYLRMEVKDEAGVLAQVASLLAGENISIELLQQKKHGVEGRVWLLLTTHECTEASINRACKKLEDSEIIFGKPFVLRIFKGL